MESSAREFPPTLSTVYEAIESDVIQLHFRYKLFKQLYATQATVDILNVVAPALFAEVRQIMLENIMMVISQLTDPPTSRGPKGATLENLTMRRLVETIDAQETGLADRLGVPRLLEMLDGHAEPIRTVRNRMLAHNDWGRRTEPMPLVMKEHIDGTIEAMERILRVTSLYFRDIDIRCEPFSHSDGDALIEILRQWQEFSKEAEPYRWGSQDEG
ncbi:MAG TPA: hypothetical protein VG406_14780 [Isosphaeraceae bacterium]|jgi:hypothetical protein|nr:hypothetical protein [Isosphaeraceae bacterium]